MLSTVLVVAFAAACFLVLAPWQLGKSSDTEHRNDLIRTATETSAVPLSDLVAAGAPLDTDTEWREVTLTGNYLPEEQVLMRLRSVAERPAAEIVTPFRLAGTDRTVLVDRGWIRPEADSSIQVPAPPTEQVTIHARLRKSEGTTEGKEPRIEDGRLTAYTVDSAAISTASGLALDPFYAQLVPDQPGGLGTIDLPQLESGPYLSYGLQWLAFGIMAPLGIAYFVWAEVKHRRALRRSADGDETEVVAEDTFDDTRAGERRRIRDDLRAASADDAAAAPEPGPAVAVDIPDDDVKAKLARRYGR
ncbi:hypothetical protein GCM10022231_24710 [Gordonia caeni]|uniref:SURF1-like protein n=1 Tax=Gordonia caeni TaxID=1007097 RepID=A0ABP7PCT2_9ACTN